MEELAGKVAVITGGASGIGRALAEAFLSEGMRVMLGDLDPIGLRKTTDELSAHGEVRGFEVDVTEQAAMDELRDATLDAFGTAHVVCNNAGVSGRRHAMAETTEADWDWVVGVNLMGVVHGIRSFAVVAPRTRRGSRGQHRFTGWAVGGSVRGALRGDQACSGRPLAIAVARIPSKRIGRGRVRAVSRLAQHRHRRVPQQLANRSARDAALPIPTTRRCSSSTPCSSTRWPRHRDRRRTPARSSPRSASNQFLVLTETPLVEQALETHVGVLRGAPPSIPM